MDGETQMVRQNGYGPEGLKRGSGPLRLILIRHGETVENAAQIAQGQRQGSLSDRGREQALNIRSKLKEVRFDAFYSSDLTRAFQTAQILIKGREGPRIITDPRLREQDLGFYEGKPVRLLFRQMRREKADLATFNPEDGEPADHFRNRVEGFLSYLVKRHFGDTVVLVTHYGVINVILNGLSSKTGEAPRKRRLTNGAMTVVEIDRSGDARVVREQPV